MVLEKIAKRMDQPMVSHGVEKHRQPHDAYGEHVAEKLRSVDPSMVPICQKIINEAIFLAEMQALNMSSRIVTDTPLVTHEATQFTRNNVPVIQAYIDAVNTFNE